MKGTDNLPHGWIRVTLGDVIGYGRTEKAEPGEIPDDAWVLELEDIEKDSSKLLRRVTFGERRSRSTKNRFERSDVLYGKLRPYLNKVVIADSPGYCTTEIVPLKPTDAVEARYLFYWLKHPAFLDYVTAVSHGLNMPRLGTDAGRKAPFVLAPRATQKHIADKLDVLLKRVDACRERLDRVPEILKRFRQSVLAAAVSGKLTEEWRSKVACRQPWSKVRLRDLCSRVSVGHVGETARHYTTPDEGVPFLRSQNVRPGKIAMEGLNYITRDFHQKLRKSQLQPGDLLVVRVGANRGDTCVLPSGLGDVNCANIVFARPNKILSSYLGVFFQSPRCQNDLLGRSVGGAQGVINTRSVEQVEVDVPPEQEQEQIVRLVTSLFDRADTLAEICASSSMLVEQVAPSVLDKAFSGGLSPRCSG